MGYSPQRKSAVQKRMLPPNTMAIRQLSQEKGIFEATLHKWRAETFGKGQLLPKVDAGLQRWSSRDKFAAVSEAATLNEADLSEYCRKRGLYPEQIAAWRAACERANNRDGAAGSGGQGREKTDQGSGAGVGAQRPHIGRNSRASGSAKKDLGDLGDEEDV